MRINLMFCITMLLCVDTVLSVKHGDELKHYIESRHDITGYSCWDERDNSGYCMDDRANVSIDDGCFAENNFCLEHNKCNRHMKCFIRWGHDHQGYEARESCTDIGGECKQPNPLYNSGIYQSQGYDARCQCGYPCVHPTYSVKCQYPSGCQSETLSCGGTMEKPFNLTNYNIDDLASESMCFFGENLFILSNPLCCIAEGGDGACDDLNGICQETTVPCGGWYVQGKCEGHHFRQCCVPPEDDSKCTDITGSTCLDTRIHPCLNGDYRSGLCSGPDTRKCCIPGCPDFYTDNGKKQSYECHIAGGCCRPYSCEVDEIELPYNCSSNCKCCIPHQDEGITCHDGEYHVGICKDSRIDDNAGCYTQSKICWRDNGCNRNMMCFIPYIQQHGTLDDACKNRGLGAHCLAPHEQCFGTIIQNICPCKYGCCIPSIDEICPYPNYCTKVGVDCAGLFIESVCGDDWGCCYESADDSKCTNIYSLGGVNGTCQHDNTSCDGWYVSNKCAGPPNRRCCKPPDEDAACTHYPGAQCLDITKDFCYDDDYRSGLCDPNGPMKRQCCIPGCLEKKINNTTGEIEHSPCYLAGGCCRPLYCEGREEQISEPCFQNETLPGLPECLCCKTKNGGGNGYGDPHFETLDHKSFQFDGHCSYILLRECKKPLHTPRFTIINKHGLMESLKGKLKAYVSKISVVIQLSSKKQFRTELLESKYVLINNGSVIDIADLGLWEDPTNGITIQPDHSKVKLDMAGEFTVWFNGNGRVDVAIDEKYHGKVCGLLGNANGDPDDDFHKLTSNGLELVSDVNEFANSWVVPGSCP